MEELELELQKIREDTVNAIRELAKPIFDRLAEVERLINDVIIKSALEVDRDDRYNSNKEKWSSKIPSEIAILEGEDFDPIAKWTDDEAGDEDIDKQIAGWLEKINKIKGITPEAKVEIQELMEGGAVEGEKFVEKGEGVNEAESPPASANDGTSTEGVEENTVKSTDPLISEDDVRAFRRGGRISPSEAKTPAHTVGDKGQNQNAGKAVENKRGK